MQKGVLNMNLTNLERVTMLQLEERQRPLRERNGIHKLRSERPRLLDHVGWRVGGLLVALGDGVQSLAERKITQQPEFERERS